MKRKITLLQIISVAGFILFSFSGNTVFAQEAIPGTALNFDGIDNYVQCGDSGSIGISNEMTIEAWIKVSSSFPAASRVGNIIGNYNHSPNFNLEGYTNGRLRFYWNEGQLNAYATNFDMRDDTWHHVAVTRDSLTNQIIFYTDGQINGIFPAGSNIDIQWPLRIGGDFRTDPGIPFNGVIEEVRLWNVARTAQEIRENMHLTLTGTETGLMSYWQFNEAAGDTTYDPLGGNNGVMNNMVASDWDTSTVPVGGGNSFTQIVSHTAIYDFAGTGLSMEFTNKIGIDTIVVSRLNLKPNTIPTNYVIFDDQYWLLNKFGDGTFAADITFTPNEIILPEDETSANALRFFNRTSNSDTSWSLQSIAVNANIANNTVLFNNISGFGQFLLGRTSEPIITNYLPLDDSINVFIDSDLAITFNKNINAGLGDIIVKRSADSTVFDTIPAASTVINDSVVIISSSINFEWRTEYYVLIDSNAFYDDSSQYHPGIYNATNWSFTVCDYFTDIAAGLTELQRSSSAWGDYDNDGDLDILITGRDIFQNLYTKIYRNDPSTGSGRVFTDINANLIGLDNGSAAWGDYDNDGDLDILITGRDTLDNHFTKIYRNHPASGKEWEFNDVNANLIGVTNGSAIWGDYDNDGDLDILLNGISGLSYVNRIYRNDSGVFNNINAGLTGIWNSSAAWGDYDNDGDLDILITGDYFDGSNNYIASVYRNDSGTFVDINAGLAIVTGGSVAWGDYDNDGDLDILLTGYAGPLFNWISIIYRNDPAADTEREFNDINAGLIGVAGSSAAWGDYDNDGDLDILLTGYTGSANTSLVYRNDSGTFTNINVGLPRVDNGSAIWGDYDNDSDLDFLLTGYSPTAIPASPISRIYGNNSLAMNTVPNSPDGLSSTILTDSLTFSWNKASDNETPQDGLSYNLLIGNSEYDVLMNPPMADENNGYRCIPAFGNACQTTSWIYKEKIQLFSLPQVIAPDYWGVQAIDHAFAGSSFAIDGINISISFLQTINDTIMQLTDTLAWEIQNGDSIINYQIQIDEDLSFSSCEVNDTLFVTLTGDGYYSISLQDVNGSDSLVAGTKYYWRVKPNYIFGLSTAFTKPAPSFWFGYVTAIEDEQEIALPKEFILYQNYPNPFNPETQIKYAIPKNAHVKIELFDMIGRKIKTLIDEQKFAGYHTLRFEAGNLASGVYLYSIQADNYISTKKMLLLK